LEAESKCEQPRWGASAARATGAALLLVAAVTVLAIFASGRLSLANLALFYLLPVMLVSGRYGLAAGLGTSVLAALAFNFFLVPPRFTMRIGHPDNLVTMAVLFVVAAAVSELAARLRQQAVLARTRAETSAALARFSEELAGAESGAAIVAMLSAALGRLDVESRIMGEADIAGLSGLDAAAARWAADNGVATGRGTGIIAGADWLFAPLRLEDPAHRLIAVARPNAGPPIDPSNALLFDGLVERAGHALARQLLAEDQAAIEQHRSRERLREALLSSVSHDLRTPLTAIRAGLDAIKPGDGAEALEAVRSEVARLERMLENLLEMTRIEAGEVRLRIEAVDLADVVADVTATLADRLSERRLKVDLAHGLPLVRSDARLLQIMLLNLVDNACKFGPLGSAIEVSAREGAEGLELMVADEGPGIAAGEEERVFDRFARLDGSDRAGGSGLGLAIVRGFGQALGLTTRASNRAEGKGAVFTIGFPRSALVDIGRQGAA
jgi:two-component system sensor histidine kinase KdpD